MLGFRAVPNPDPSGFALKLAGPADRAVIRLWTPALVLVGTLDSLPLGAGWRTVPIPASLWALAPRGLLYATVQLQRGAQRSLPVAPLRLVRLR